MNKTKLPFFKQFYDEELYVIQREKAPKGSGSTAETGSKPVGLPASSPEEPDTTARDSATIPVNPPQTIQPEANPKVSGESLQPTDKKSEPETAKEVTQQDHTATENTKTDASVSAITSKVAVIVDDPYTGDEVSPKFRVIAGNILKALNIQSENIVFYRADQSGETAQITSGRILYFGKESSLPGFLNSEELKNRLLISPSLGEIAESLMLKRELWKNLQKLFADVVQAR